MSCGGTVGSGFGGGVTANVIATCGRTGLAVAGVLEAGTGAAAQVGAGRAQRLRRGPIVVRGQAPGRARGRAHHD